MGNIPLALQAYSIREDCAKDLAGTLAAGGRTSLIKSTLGWSSDRTDCEEPSYILATPTVGNAPANESGTQRSVMLRPTH